MEYIPIDELYFRSLKFPSRNCQKKSVCLDPDYNWLKRAHYNHQYKLKNVQEVIDHFRTPGSIEKAKSILRLDNWEYFNCLLAGFRKNVLDTDAHKVNGTPEISLEERNNTLSLEYYNSLGEMSDDAILKFNKNNPIDFDSEFIRHGTHRTYAMIGRLVRGERYIPFYVKKESFNPIIKVKYLRILDDLQIPRSEYTICQSSMLTLMDNRPNDDLDIVVSNKLRHYSLDGEVHGCKIHSNIEVFGKNHKKFRAFGCKDDDDLIQNYSVNIAGYNFVEPRFYFSRIWPENTRKINDQQLIHYFMNSELRNITPFNIITDKQWGFGLLPTEKNEENWKKLTSI
jgi:hypothetical protein